MRKLIASSLLAAGTLFYAGAASASDCGAVTIAEMDWESATLLANIDAIILGEGYDCDVTLVPGGTMITFATMDRDGQPDIAPELWINAFRDDVNAAVSDGRLHIAAQALTDGGVEGWWIPAFIAEAHPEIRTIRDALDRPDLFPHPTDEEKAAIHNCPSGWNCRISTSNLFRAFEAQKEGFELVGANSGAELDASIDKAFETNTGWLGYYWAPTATLGKHEMVLLSFGVPHDQEEWNRCTSQTDCDNPQPNAWPKSEVYTVVTDAFQKRGSEAYTYLSTRGWGNRTVNAMLAWMADNEATGEEGAKHFLETYPEIWNSWVTPEVADKINNYLANS